MKDDVILQVKDLRLDRHIKSRCPYATERCKTEVPDLYQIGDRKVRCFLHENRKQVV